MNKKADRSNLKAGGDQRSDTGKAARAAYSWMESKELYGWKGWYRYVCSCVVLKINLTY